MHFFKNLFGGAIYFNVAHIFYAKLRFVLKRFLILGLPDSFIYYCMQMKVLALFNIINIKLNYYSCCLLFVINNNAAATAICVDERFKLLEREIFN